MYCNIQSWLPAADILKWLHQLLYMFTPTFFEGYSVTELLHKSQKMGHKTNYWKQLQHKINFSQLRKLNFRILKMNVYYNNNKIFSNYCALKTDYSTITGVTSWSSSYILTYNKYLNQLFVIFFNKKIPSFLVCKIPINTLAVMYFWKGLFLFFFYR